MNKKPDAAILARLIELGYAVADLGDGAWAWTTKGHAEVDGMERMELSNMLWGQGGAMSDLLWPEIKKKFGIA